MMSYKKLEVIARRVSCVCTSIQDFKVLLSGRRRGKNWTETVAKEERVNDAKWRGDIKLRLEKVRLVDTLVIKGKGLWGTRPSDHGLLSRGSQSHIG